MQFYPEFAHGRASEVWHGTKWLLDAPDDILTPTARVNGEIYWVDELSQLSDGGYFIPTRFFIVAPKDGKSNDPKALWARGHNVYLHEVISRICSVFGNNTHPHPSFRMAFMCNPKLQ